MFNKFFKWLKNDDGLSEIKGVAINEIVDSIKRSMVKMQQDMESSGIKIKKIEITLKTIAVEDFGAESKLQIPILGELNIGSKLSKKTVQTINLTLKLPKPTKKWIEKIQFMKMDETIEKSILDIAEGVKAAINNPPILELEDASVEFNFILKSDSEISMIIESGFESELTNNMTVTFEKMD
jgi:hypothetical protein